MGEMETTALYTSDNPEAVPVIAKQSALEIWGSFIASAEAILKTPGMTVENLTSHIEAAFITGHLAGSVPSAIHQNELNKLINKG